jgi:hypothetical protein
MAIDCDRRPLIELIGRPYLNGKRSDAIAPAVK